MTINAWTRCEHTEGTADGRIRQCVKAPHTSGGHIVATVLTSAIEMTCVHTGRSA